MTPIYLDHHAGSPTRPEVWDAVRRAAEESAGANPASAHAAGRRARRVLEDAREKVAALLNADPSGVVFTSGATEANNLAVLGLAGKPPAHLVGSRIEHPCVVEPLERLARRGHAVSWVSPSADGVIDADAVLEAVTPQTRLVTLMFVNHETGAFQPVCELAARLPAGVRLHCDAAQAVGKFPVSFRALGVSTLALSGHKFGAPPGVGALLVRDGLTLEPLALGGHQQQGRRPGTESVPLAAGLAVALEIAVRDMEAAQKHVARLRAAFVSDIADTGATPYGPVGAVSPFVVNVAFPGCPADALLARLDLEGVACSAGSACASGSLAPSPVLLAMGVARDAARRSLRFSFGPGLSVEEVEEAARRVCRAAARVRAGQED